MITTNPVLPRVVVIGERLDTISNLLGTSLLKFFGGSNDVKCPKPNCGSTDIEVRDQGWGGKVGKCRDCGHVWTL